MDLKELRTKNAEELGRLLAEAERDERELRRKITLRSVPKTADALKSRRLIAQIKTVLAEQTRSTNV